MTQRKAVIQTVIATMKMMKRKRTDSLWIKLRAEREQQMTAKLCLDTTKSPS